MSSYVAKGTLRHGKIKNFGIGNYPVSIGPVILFCSFQKEPGAPESKKNVKTETGAEVMPLPKSGHYLRKAESSRSLGIYEMVLN